MGEAGRVSTAGAVAYQRHPLLVRLFSETEVARGTDGHCHRHGAGGVGMKMKMKWVSVQKRAFDKAKPLHIYIQLHIYVGTQTRKMPARVLGG